MILKAIRDYNLAKLSLGDQQTLEGIIGDIFKANAIATKKGGASAYGNLRGCLVTSFQSKHMDTNESMIEKALYFYELVQAKHGIIVVGEANSGKSTLIGLLERALNKS